MGIDADWIVATCR